MGRTIAGAVLLLFLVFFARNPYRIAGLQPVDAVCPPPADSSRTATAQDAPSGSPDDRPAVRPVLHAYTRHPLVFLSRAPVDSLMLLKGIGPVLAERIAEARSGKGLFSSWEEILAVKGIGPKKLALLKAQAGIAD